MKSQSLERHPFSQRSASIVEISNLCREYTVKGDSKSILKGLDLSLSRGEYVSIVGRSGAGKTTLLRIIGALDRKYTGSVSVAGKELRLQSESELASLRNMSIGFVFQFHFLIKELTA